MDCFYHFTRFSTFVILLFALSYNCTGQASLNFDKSFDPATIGPGSNSLLTFTITNTGTTLHEGITFTDNLPAGILISTPANMSTSCQDAIISAPDGGTTVSVTNGRLGALSSCEVVLHVIGSAIGVHSNITSSLSSDSGGSGPASADLTVAADRPGFSKAFSPATISPGSSSKLTFTIDNSAVGSVNLTGIGFFDNLPGNLVVASPSNTATSCILGSGSLSASPGSSQIFLSANGTMLAGTLCTVEVDVTSSKPGFLRNISSELSSTPSGGLTRTSGFAAADISISNQVLTKSFSDDPVAPGGQVTLDFTLNNFDDIFSGREGFGDYVNISFTDNLEDVLPGTDDLIMDSATNTCGGTVTGIGTDLISFTGGSISPGQSCKISAVLSVDDLAPTGTYTNTTSNVSYDVGGNPVTGNTASDDLVLRADPILTKEFLDAVTFASDPVVGGGDDVIMRFTIQNTSGVHPATDIAFIDDMTKILPFPILATVPSTPCGAGSSIAVVSLATERQGLALTSGNLVANGSCSFDVTLTLPTDITQGTHTNTTEEITATINSEQVTGKPATDDLSVANAPNLVKVFSVNQVAPGDNVDLTFILEHGNNAPGDASNVAFTDILDGIISGLTTVGTLNSGTCNGTVAENVAGTLTYTGGSMLVDETCSFTVTLDVPSTAPSVQFTNTTSAVTGVVTVGSNSVNVVNGEASDVLEILSLTLDKEFTDDPVLPGSNVNMQFNITNETPDNVTDIAFTDDLDDVIVGLTSVGPLSVGTCGGTLIESGGVLNYSGGALGPNASCSFDVVLTVPGSADEAVYTNITSEVTATISANTVTSLPGTDKLLVASAPNLLTLTKNFNPGHAEPGETVALDFNISFEGGAPATNISFMDDLEAVLTGLTMTAVNSNTCGGSVSGASVITYSGGSLAPGTSCDISVNVAIPIDAPNDVYINTTSAINADGGISGNIATTVLVVIGDPALNDPIANAGIDSTIDCGSIMLDGSESIFFNANPTYTWVENGSTIATGATPTVSFSPGVHIVELTVTDDGGSDTDEVIITVNPDTEDPVISCPADVTVSNDPGQCEASGVIFGDATATDTCDDDVDITNDAPSVFPLGITDVTWTATDDAGNTDICVQKVTVVDDEGPSFTLEGSASLWPPNGKYVNFDMSDMVTSVMDNCDGNILISSISIISGTSDEPENGSGDGNTVNDIDIAQDCQSVQVRRERQGSGNGRVYTIKLEVQDNAGNISQAAYLITIPKSKNGSPAVDDGPVYTEMCGSSLRSDIVKSAFSQFFVTPNPSSSEIFMSLEGFEEKSPVKIDVYNIQGQRIFYQQINRKGAKRNRLDISNFNEGTYHIVATQNEKQMTSTFIKIR